MIQKFLVWSRPSTCQKVSLSKELNTKLAPESLVYECGEMIIPPNEKVVSTASVKWTKLSRKAPYTYSPFNSYSSFSMRGKCFCNLFLCRCCELSLLLQYLRLQYVLHFSPPPLHKHDFFFPFSILFCIHLKDGCVFSVRWPRCCSVYPAHTRASLSGLAGQRLGKGLGFYGTPQRLCVVLWNA